jgi:hypothetical protein
MFLPIIDGTFIGDSESIFNLGFDSELFRSF